MSNQELLDVLKQHLTISLDEIEVYNGGCDGSGNMYNKRTIVRLYFFGELITESL